MLRLYLTKTNKKHFIFFTYIEEHTNVNFKQFIKLEL